MKIVVNHLTRMQKGFMCVAGLDLATGRHVRPLLQSQMRIKFLARHGGPFDIGAIVDLGWTKRIGKPPAGEDHLFHREEVKRVGDMPPADFWQLLEKTAKSKLVQIFGEELARHGLRSYGIGPGRGSASLGCYIPPGRARLLIQRQRPGSRGRIRMAFSSGDYEFELGVTDIRLYGEDHVTPDEQVVARANERLQTTAGLILSVGLTRAFSPSSDQPELHWLQVNNIHFQDDPCWQLG